MKKMMLLTKELRRRIPAFYGTEQTPTLDKIAQASFFLADCRWYWYPIEFDGQDECFGLVVGTYVEFGSFQLSSLGLIRGPWGYMSSGTEDFSPCQCARCSRAIVNAQA